MRLASLGLARILGVSHAASAEGRSSAQAVWPAPATRSILTSWKAGEALLQFVWSVSNSLFNSKAVFKFKALQVA